MINSLEKSLLEMILAKQSRFDGCTDITLADEIASQTLTTWDSNGSVTFEAAPRCCLLDDDNCVKIIEPKSTHRRRAKKS